MNLKDLKKEIPYKWKIQSFTQSGDKASCVAYIDARDVMDLLDEVCGPESWQDEYKEVHGRLVAGVGIKVSKEEWIWKWDTGTPGDYEKEKSEFSDSFKRAAVKWGVGRFLYSMDIQWVSVSNKKPIDDKGSRIWDLTEYIENNKSPVPRDKVSSRVILEINKLAEELDLKDKLSTMLDGWNYKSVEELNQKRGQAVVDRLRQVKKERKNK